MSTLTSRRPPILQENTNNRDIISGCATPESATNAALTLANACHNKAELDSAQYRGPPVRYTAFPNTKAQTATHPKLDVPSGEDGSACTPTLLNYSIAQRPVKKETGVSRPVPFDPAVPCSNRPNDQSLATIQERGSQSTLESRGSLLNSQNRYAPIRPFNGPTRSLSHVKLGHPDKQRLAHVSEDACNGSTSGEATAVHVKANGQSRVAMADREAAVATTEDFLALHKSCTPHAGKINDIPNNSVKGFLRAVLQNVRDASRPSPSASLKINRQFGRGQKGQAAGSEKIEPLLQSRDIHGAAEHRDEKPIDQRQSSINSPFSRLPPAHEPYQSCELNHSTTSGISAHYCQPASATHSPSISDHDGGGLTSPHYLSPSCDQSSKKERSTPEAGPTGRAADHAGSETASRSTRSRDDFCIRYTYDGVPLYRTNAPSLYEYDRAAEASICSTESTSYSGTVLGIDVDLQGEGVRSRSSLVSAGLVPQPSSEFRHASTSPYDARQDATTSARSPPPQRSIKSSALPVLLPLAAASGIVRPNHATPQLSFFSPSGNLIQAEPSSSSPASSTSYYRNSFHVARASASEPLARPALLPATTPPSIALPRHLQQHSNHHHAHSHIIPQTIIPSTVKGCDGVVRASSLQPSSGISRNRRAVRNTSRCPTVAPCISLPNPSKVTHPRPRPDRKRPAIGPLAGWTLRVCFCQPYDGSGDPDAACLGQVDRCDDPAHGLDSGLASSEAVENARVVSNSGAASSMARVIGRERKKRDSGVVV